MSILKDRFFFFPIHLHTKDDYYYEHDKWIEEQKVWYEKRSGGEPYDELSFERKVHWDEIWFWPLWEFNDIVGFLDIGMDGGECMVADLYFKRKYFPRGHRRKYWSAAYSARHFDVKKNHEIFHFCEVGRIFIDITNNKSFVEGLMKIIEEAKVVIAERSPKLQLWLPAFDLSCFNFVCACRNPSN
ncbi:hypothetical protein KJ596_01720 [Patescibacteria group bacterium]|nr:hypothetical protein [Patescibacteria group bacterium]MBU1868380.1 hypothetical protein [Patescibacteria group bacterium]